MIRHALILCAAIFSLTANGCAPPPPPPSALELAANLTVAACKPADFLNEISVIVPPVSGSKNVILPPPQTLPQAISTDLGNAYCNAPRTFRHQLDDLDFIFIDATMCPGGDLNHCPSATGDVALGASWGMRAGGGYTQIGIPGTLWPNGQSAEAYPAYEQDILNSLLKWSALSSRPSFSSTDINVSSSWMTVLAALAHEMGHVRWAEVNIRSGYGQPYDFKKMMDCGFFVGWDNTASKALQPKKRWRSFGSQQNEASNDHDLSPELSDFKSATDDNTRGADLNALLSPDQGNPIVSQPWATYLAANAPDEDFVETYKFAVLTKATPGLTSMPIFIPTGGQGTSTVEDVPNDYINNKKTSLASKVKCFKMR